MELTFALKKSPAFVFDYLTDMDKFAKVHPVITKIEHLGSGDYLVYETLKLGFIPYSFTYRVTIASDPVLNRIVINAVVMKMTRITMDYSIRPEGNGSVVDEIITIKSALPVKGIVQKVFREQHHQLFTNIDKL